MSQYKSTNLYTEYNILNKFSKKKDLKYKMKKRLLHFIFIMNYI
jgi:hypothetical protein